VQEESKKAQEADAEAEDAAALLTEKRKREVPKLLPLEFLDSDDEDVVMEDDEPMDSGSKRRRVAAPREPKGPKDKRVGSTVYKVVQDRGEQKLAPKLKKQSLNVREDMLRRNRIAPPRGGFFVK